MLFIADALRDSPNNPVGSARWRQRQGCVVLVVGRVRHRARHATGQALVTLAARPPPTPGRGLGVHHHYSR